QRGAARGQLKLPPGVGAEDAIQLPPSKDGTGGTSCRPRFTRAERELPHAGQLEVVRRIERRGRAVAIEDARSVPQELRPVAIVRHVSGPRECVRAFEEQATRQASIDRGL